MLKLHVKLMRSVPLCQCQFPSFDVLVIQNALEEIGPRAHGTFFFFFGSMPKMNL